MIPTKEQLKEGRVDYRSSYAYLFSFCKWNKTCKECDRIIRFGCKVKKKIGNLQIKRILRICKPESKEDE